MKKRDLLHKYLVGPITTHTHVRRKSNERSRCIEKTENKEKRYYIPIQDHPLCQAEEGGHCSNLLLAIYMAVSMPGHGDLTAILMSRMALS